MTIRGEPVAVKDGEYRLRLKMRTGSTASLWSRHTDTARALRLDRQPGAPDPPPSSGCPPGQIPQTQMGVQYCRPTGPTVCPEGQVAAGEEACAPTEAESDGLVPCTYGAGFCTAEENQAESDTAAPCGTLDPSRIDEEGNYIPLPGY